MAKRKIITIDEKKCNGCSLCIPNCPEGAIQIIDNKARLVSDLFCDGLGACLGHCPQEAISIEEREAEEYSESKVMENIVKQGKNTIIAHLKHLKEHRQEKYLKEALDFLKKNNIKTGFEQENQHAQTGCPGSRTQLWQWPVQLMLVPAHASYLQDADILIAADCVPFAYADFHEELLNGKALLVGCPKLDDTRIYEEKLGQIFKNNDIKSVTYAHMEVPCCFGLVGIIRSAIQESGKKILFKEIIISISGEKIR
ncbi:MAG: 4Fe-4S binding protein [Candidatus Omnitrophica bacterium]|nr:4Fe-4S binding protein [Candidatus Omnitrophota bacterium]